MPEDISKKITITVEAETDDLQKNITALNQTLDSLLQRQKQISDSGKDNKKVFTDIAAQVDKTRQAIETYHKAVDDAGKTVVTTNGSLVQNKALLESLKQQYDKLTGSQGEHAKGTKDLNTQIGTLANTIAQQEEKLDKSRKVFDLHKGTTDALKSSFDKLKGVSGDFGPSLQEAARGFDALKMGLSVVKTGFNSVGGAIKTTGFGLLVLVLQSVTDYLTKSKEGTARLKGAISAIGKVIEMVNKGFARLGEIIIDAVTHPVESIKTLANLIEQNIVNRFKAFSVVLDGIIHLDFKKMADGVMQSVTGVTNATDKITHTFNTLKTAAVSTWKEVNKAYDDGVRNANKASRKIGQIHPKSRETITQKDDGSTAAGTGGEQQNAVDTEQKKNDMAEQLKATMENYAKELSETDEHYRQLSARYKDFLDSYNGMSDEQKAKHQQEYKVATDAIIKLEKDRTDEKLKVTEKYNTDMAALRQGKQVNTEPDKALLTAQKQTIDDLNTYDLEKAKETDDKKTAAAKRAEQQRQDFAFKTASEISGAAFSILQNSIKAQSAAKLAGLEADKTKELSNSNLTSAQKLAIEANYKQKEDQVKLKAFKDEQKASMAQAIINGAIAVTKAEAQTGVLGELVIPAIIAQTAIQVATIASQKPPQYAQGGLHYASDGKGALLPGYSRTDNTNAYLRSGEAVVVSEAMRDPWARNLVSAINVAYGGRDFAVTNPTRGYAIGGIFTDGGNTNRYYNQPVHDQKDLANTIAYQMINNFPPIYVDVKDVNNQQNILAQTTNRVNL